MSVKIHGYEHSVYSWIARLVLDVKGVPFEWSEVDPFSNSLSPSYLDLHPFNRVPTLQHDAFILYETNAITRYIDEQFTGPTLQPSEPNLRAIQNQLISVADNYAYWPLVRQVFSHQVFRPKFGECEDKLEITNGLITAKLVLKAIEDLALNAQYLVYDEICLADIHVYPIIAYFAAASDGHNLLQQYPRLTNWFGRMSEHPSVQRTKPKILQ